MKHPFDLHDLILFLAQQNLPLSSQQQDRFENYLNLLHYWTRKQNLVSKSDIAHIVERHFLPSLFLCFCLPEKIDGSIIDIGSGGGFPGVLIKIMRPEQPITLLDSSRKKVLFLEEVCDQLALDCRVICERCENYNNHAAEQFQIAVARAVTSLDVLWMWAAPLLVEKGALYALKGGDCHQEIRKMKQINTRIEIKRPEETWVLKSSYMQQKCTVVLEK